jgi:hypothetical protein
LCASFPLQSNLSGSHVLLSTSAWSGPKMSELKAWTAAASPTALRARASCHAMRPMDTAESPVLPLTQLLAL